MYECVGKKWIAALKLQLYDYYDFIEIVLQFIAILHL